MATVTLARAWQAPTLEAIAALLYVTLVGLWAVVAIRTAQATKTGKIWQR